MNPFADSREASIALDKMMEARVNLHKVISEQLKGYSCPYCGVTGGTETFDVTSKVTKTEYFLLGQRESELDYSRKLLVSCRQCTHEHEYPAGSALPEEIKF
jgi:hypothetical protein